jgi:AcrR family transcriptional regulator
MTVRKDGEDTRRRILQAACRVFAEKGYEHATHSDICEQAGANVASINYHFGSKEELYRAVWQHVFGVVDAKYPLDGGVTEDADPEERLRGFVRAMINRVTDDSMGSWHEMHMGEFFRPTGLVDDLLKERLSIYRDLTCGIMRGLLGEGADERDVELCEMSVVSQCRMVRSARRRRFPPSPWKFGRDDVDRLVEHISEFSLAGIAARRRQGLTPQAAPQNGERVCNPLLGTIEPLTLNSAPPQLHRGRTQGGAKES